MENIKQRSSYWDNLKGILIYLVVFAHILYQLQSDPEIINRTVDLIYMFHMPAFVFVSGYFGKSEHSRSEYSIAKLLFLFFIFNSIMGFMFGFDSIIEPVYSYWYIIALIFWRLTSRYVEKIPHVNMMLFAIAIFAGFFNTLDNSFAAARIIAFYPYYMAGYMLTTEKSSKTEKTAFWKRFPKGLVIFAAIIVAVSFSYDLFEYTDNMLLMGPYSDEIEAFGRIFLYIVAFSAIYALLNMCPDKEISFLSMFGRNSLWIYIFHRPFTLWLSMLIEKTGSVFSIIVSITAAFVICIIFGNDIFAKYFEKFAHSGADLVLMQGTKKFDLAKLSALLVALGFVASIISTVYKEFDYTDILNGNESGSKTSVSAVNTDVIYPVMSSEEKAAFDNAFRITFAGDLILLEDQVKRGYTDGGYDFSPVFEYAEKYISSADYAIGVFEGPMAGKEAGYSTSNFDDGKELYLNFPDEFAYAVKNAGFDLVTTANNHLLDKGIDGAKRTLDVLDSVGLDHIGSYRNAKEKENNRIKIVESDGIKMAVLSYTYGSNYYTNDQLIYSPYLCWITSVINGTDGEIFEKMKADVEKDFEEAKKYSPDLIIVLPHMGTQFSNDIDSEQKAWFDIFKQCGADIILGDHPHAVEPALIENYGGKNVFTAYCPGNFANIYRKDQGDTSMLTDVYIDRDTKKIIGGSVVPLYTQAAADGNFRAIPIYEIVNNTELRRELSTDDIERARYANDIVTEVVLGGKMNIDNITERYYFNENGFIREKTSGLEITDEMRHGILYKAMEKADSICFIGDSVTEGTKNGGCPWYEPIESFFPGKKIFNFSKGGCTVSYINENADDIPTSDLYVIAVGTNDVRYRDETQCAMTADIYAERINTLKKKLSEKNNSANFIFIAPWYSIDGDIYCSLSFSKKTALNNEYSYALENYCKENNLGYINANNYIKDMFEKYPDSVFLLDHIHPNAGKGVIMYSEAVLSAE